MEKFNTPKSPAPGQGQENYDLILDGFAPNDATLTANQKKQLDSIAARVKEIISKGDPEATKNRLVVGGFGDSMDTDPMAASEQRTQAVANYLAGKGVPKETLDSRPFGATWARYEASTKKAQEGRNRRVQIRCSPHKTQKSGGPVVLAEDHGQGEQGLDQGKALSARGCNRP